MSNAAKLLAEAVAHHQQGRLPDAEKAYRKLLRADAVNVDGLRLLGGLYLQTGQVAQAAECLEKAVRLRPKDPETLTNLGIALRKTGRNADALARYRQALEIQPEYLSALNNLGALQQEAGRNAEAVDAYGRVLRLQPENPGAHYNYGNALLVSGKVGDAIARYEHALKLKPDYLEAMINLGMALSQAGQGDRSREWLGVAQSWFEKALKADPNNTVAMNNIGNVLRQQGKPEQAVDYYRKALKLRPDYAQAAVNLATSLRDLGRTEEAIESCRAALRIMPDSTDARINMGSFLQELAQHEDAIVVFEEALQRKPSSIDARWNRSISLLALGRYAEGWPLHEVGLGVAHMRGEYPSPERRWNGENFAGKRLLIWAEQGLGDSLQFVRYAEMCKARGGTVILHCPRPLRKLFANCSFIDAVPDSITEADFDIHVPMMSLPFVFGTLVETIPAQVPYLHIGAEARAKWAGKVPDAEGFKVGLVWAGNPRENQISANMVDRRRSMSLEMLRPLFDVPGVQFYNLQMATGAAQIEAAGLSSRFIDPMAEVKNFEDTGAIIERLDLTLSVDTSVVHLAGGLGQPVWVMSRFDACWRWLRNRADSPWYPTARVFGQPAPGDWDSVVMQVRAALVEKIKQT